MFNCDEILLKFIKISRIFQKMENDSMTRFKAALSNSIETTQVDFQIGQDVKIFPSPPS